MILCDAGMAACIAGSCALMRSTVSMMFEPGCLKTKSMTDGWPLMKPPERRFSVASTTSATSRRRTTASPEVLTIRSL